MNLEIRQYGRTELAQLYRTDISPASAWKSLKHWFEINADLTAALHRLGYDGRSRSFTPAQVAVIVEYLGEP